MSLQATLSTGTDGSAQGAALATRIKAVPFQAHVSSGFWKGACLAAPLGLTSWLVIAWLLSRWAER